MHLHVRGRAAHAASTHRFLASRDVTTMNERLREVYRRVAALPRQNTAAAAFAQFCETLDEVEDEMSGVVKQLPPPADGGGRMYCPLPDRTSHLPDGGIDAVTTGHTIHVSAYGDITVRNRRTGEVEFSL